MDAGERSIGGAVGGAVCRLEEEVTLSCSWMVVVTAEGEDMQRSEENSLECQNCPDPTSEFQEETDFGEAPSLEMILREPQDSDCFTSVFLAVFLALVFILVSWFLLPCNKGSLVLLHDFRALRSVESCPVVPSLGSLCRLFPNQLESTWQVLQQHMNHEPHRCQTDGAWILAAVGQEDAGNTLMCFLKAVLLLVTDERGADVRFVEQSGAWLPWMGVLGNRTSAIATTEIYMGRSRVPYGVMVSLWSLTSGNQSGAKISLAWLLNVTEQAREEFLLHDLMPATVSGILSGVRFADRVPSELKTTQGNVPVVFVRPEWYLEGGLFC